MAPAIFILTGGPCAGKSTTLAEIAGRGFAVIPEAAAAVILEGRLHPARDALAFQREVLRRQLAAEAAAPAGPVFEDRGVGDHFGYLDHHRARGLDLWPQFGEELERAWEEARGRYRAVFLLAPSPAFRGAAYRSEDRDEARRIHAAIAAAYRARHPRVIEVPWVPVVDRVGRILREAEQGD